MTEKNQELADKAYDKLRKENPHLWNDYADSDPDDAADAIYDCFTDVSCESDAVNDLVFEHIHAGLT